MAAVRLLQPFTLFFLFSTLVSSMSDTDALLKLKKSFSHTDELHSWSPGSEPCNGKESWVGVVCYKGIITGLHLGKMGLSGKIDVDALQEIPALRSISFLDNDFSGPIPEFHRLGALKAIYISGNKFSGEIPSDYFEKMDSLKKVWLSGNGFTGEIPISLLNLPHLIELHLENNQFSGKIPPIKQTLSSFNVSNNKLEGEIPASLSKFHASSFMGNDGLCGTQLGKDCNSMAMESAGKGDKPDSVKVGIGSFTLICLLLLFLAMTIVVMKRRAEFDVLGRENLEETREVYITLSSNRREMESSWKGMDSSRRSSNHLKGSYHKKGSHHGKSSHHGNKGSDMGDLVVVNDEKGIFGLQDLMKASAEVLGNGGLGSAYKAVMSSGVAVAVKRMREMDRIGKDEFDEEMRRLGSLRHKNILAPLAYHYRKEEKLIVYEHIPKGSLLYLLHGDRGRCNVELDWPSRLKIIKGIARGLGFLHKELASYDVPHGNLKSSNIFIGSEYEPLLSDYGYCAFVNSAQALHALLAYKTPEAQQQHHQVSSKCDVYCLGIIILEILTGKFPSQYLNNGQGGTDIVRWVTSAISERREIEVYDPEIAESGNSSLSEIERMLHVGVDCVKSDPEKRLEMKDAIKRIEEIQIKGAQDGVGIQLAPSLRDGCAELSSVSSRPRTWSVREGYGELSARRPGQESIGERRNGDSFAFDIS